MAECILAGRRGEQGPQGIQGPQGATGATGPQGPTGPSGGSIQQIYGLPRGTTHSVPSGRLFMTGSMFVGYTSNTNWTTKRSLSVSFFSSYNSPFGGSNGFYGFGPYTVNGQSSTYDGGSSFECLILVIF